MTTRNGDPRKGSPDDVNILRQAEDADRRLERCHDLWRACQTRYLRATTDPKATEREIDLAWVEASGSYESVLDAMREVGRCAHVLRRLRLTRK